MAFANPLTAKPTNEEPTSEAGRVVTEAQYWETYYHNDDIIYEWNNGVLEEKPVSDYAQYTVYLWFLNLLKDFLYVTKSGRMIGLELGFRLPQPEKVTIRKPDLAVVAQTNPVPLGDKDPSYKGVFDLCIESLSTTNKQNIERDTVVKRMEYQDGGVKEYYILDERKIETQFYTLNDLGLYRPLQPINGIVHSKALPGFQFRIDDLYDQPEPPAMVEDPIYSDFISPFLRAERLRTIAAQEEAEQHKEEAEQHRAVAEQHRAVAEQHQEEAKLQKAKAERYAALLREAGISLDETS